MARYDAVYIGLAEALDCRHGARSFDVRRLELPQLAGEAVRCECHQDFPLHSRHARHRLRQPRRLDEGPDPEHRRGTAMKHHPVVDSIRGEKLPPTLFTHAAPPPTLKLQPHVKNMTFEIFCADRWDELDRMLAVRLRDQSESDKGSKITTAVSWDRSAA